MDLLSLVGLATRQRGEYFTQAERLAKQYRSLSKLEERMAAEGKVIVKGLRDQQMKFDEYERAMVDKTLTAALAAVYLGAGNSRPKEKMESAWGGIVGHMLPPLKGFLDETKIYLDNGVLKYHDDAVDFADPEDDDTDPFLMYPEEFPPEEYPEIPENSGKRKKEKSGKSSGSGAAGILGVSLGYPESLEDEADLIDEDIDKAKQGRAQGKTWKGVNSRVERYLSTPLYSFFMTGEFMGKVEQGFTEMRRAARLDKKTCIDCIRYDRMGWQPIGTLPMPGIDCRCFDRCRCHIEYR